MTALDQIRAHLATSDAAARAATPGEWKVSLGRINLIDGEKGAIANCVFSHSESPNRTLPAPDECKGNALHIATHSPAAILRMNAVVRELVEAVERAPHERNCLYRMIGDPCDCWKSEALQRAAERLQPAPAGKEGR